LAAHGVDNISLEALSASDFTNQTAFDVLHNLDAAIHLADQGHTGHLTLSITDAQAGALVAHNFDHFQTGDAL
ncbi:hypothetical protein G6644_09295, partial [Polynucleobacter paneuropaeus]|nr:hypothetical protein [Polynucleobacter paneuropaeus]MBT8639244.1 hypothetical protein [Polynucleobacter paneuropaeus]